MRRFSYRVLERHKESIHSYFLRHNDWENSYKISGLPCSWQEFNKIYFSRCPVVIRFHKKDLNDWISVVSMVAALKKFVRRQDVGLIGIPYALGAAHLIDDMHCALSGKPFSLQETVCVDWVYEIEPLRMANVENLFTLVSDDIFSGDDIIKLFKETSLLKKFKDRLCGYPLSGYKPNMVILWGEGNAESQYDALKMEYGKKILFIEPTREKDFVNEWFKDNDTFLDPLLDIKLIGGKFDMKGLLTYVATNWLFKFREYAKFYPEVVEKAFNKNELSEFGV